MGNKVFEKYGLFLPATLLLAFSLPFYRQIVVYLIALWVLAWIAEGRFRSKWELFKSRQAYFWALSAIVWIQIIGMSYSMDTPEGWFQIEKKLSLLIFPMVLSTVRFSKEEIQKIIKFFVAGVWLAGTICFIRALSITLAKNDTDYLFYNYFSWFIHPTYFGLYLSIALLFVITKMSGSRNAPLHRRILVFTSFIYTLLLIILLNSKATLLTTALLIVIWQLALVFAKKRLNKTSISVFAVILLLAVGALFYPKTTRRINAAFKSLTSISQIDPSKVTDGTAIRLLIWKESVDLIKAKPLSGYGTGSSEKVLIEKYKDKNITYAQQTRLNAHNQFFHQMIDNGIPGLLALLLLLFFPFYHSFRKKDYFFMALVAILGINMMFENMLGLQAGIVFTAFFCGLAAIQVEQSKPVD